ncbi:MAG TPA: heme-binding domain-containing protein [Ferruginibacter sp.]|nr:heme-binding domain-containing protein [Ferruginibacter sp.]
MLKKIFKGFLLLLLFAFIIIQFFRPAKNKADGPGANHISKLYAVPGEVKNILKTSCDDCHSNNTVYPWYAHVQPVAWWLDNHIKDGKKHLDFSEFASYNLRRQYHKLEEIDEMVEKDLMPLDSYLWVHKGAKLAPMQRRLIASWVSAVMDTMKANYPIDSLIRKK